MATPFYRPRTVCLLGPPRLAEDFNRVAQVETLAGRIVLAPHVYPTSDLGETPEELMGEEMAAILDNLQLWRVDLADEVVVLDDGGLADHATIEALAYARSAGRMIRRIARTPRRSDS